MFSAQRGEMELVGAVLNCGTWFETGETLLDWAFERFYPVQMLAAGEIAAEIPVRGGVRGYACATTRKDFKVPVTNMERCTLEMELPEALTAPVSAGQAVGWAHAMIDGRTVASMPLYAAESVDQRDYLAMLRRLIKHWRLWP